MGILEPDQRKQDERASEFVRTHDVTCPNCGYNLRGVPGRICPECAEPFDPADLASAGKDYTFVDLISMPVVSMVLVVLNVALFAVAKWWIGDVGIVYFVLTLALFVSGATWRALGRDKDDLVAAVRGDAGYRSGFSRMLMDFLSFWLSRTAGAETWAPVACLVLTLAHIAYVFVRLYSP